MSSIISTLLAISIMIPVGIAIGFLYARCGTESGTIIQSAYIASFSLVSAMLFVTAFMAPISLYAAVVLAVGVSVPWMLTVAGSVQFLKRRG